MDEDTVPPLRSMDRESMATASGSNIEQSPARIRRAATSIQLGQMHSSAPLKRTRSRQFSQSSVDSFLPPRVSETAEAEESKPSSPFRFGLLVLVALPVIGGLLFENGGSATVDLLLVVIGCLLLYWSTEYPWEWYNSARTLVSLEDNPDFHDDSAVLDDSDEEDKDEDRKEGKHEKSPKSPAEEARQQRRDKAARSLGTHELVALLFCFICPPAAAYTLHRIRHYLARPHSSPVENAPLTIFVLGAEILPIRRVAEMVLSRTLHLQRVVTSYDSLEIAKRREARSALSAQLEDLARRLQALEEGGVAPVTSSVEPKAPELPPASEQGRLNHQTQLDALNRAVRRYEKRALTQSIMVEGRLRDLEGRINDALTLAAAASRENQRAGVVYYTLGAAATLFQLPLTVARTILSWPVEVCSEFYRFLFGPRKKKKKPRTKADETKAVSRPKSDGQ